MLATDGDESFAIFLYAEIEWATADPRTVVGSGSSASGSGSGSASGSASGSGSGSGRSASGRGSSASGSGSGSGSGSLSGSGSSASGSADSGGGIENSTDPSSEVPTAQIGFNAGDGERFATLPGSRTEAVLNLNSTSNVGGPGLWIFRVDGDNVTSGGMS